jgi:RNA recognition motif-containing protein
MEALYAVVGVVVGFVVGIIVGKSGSAKPAAKAGPGKPSNRAPKKPSGDGIELYVGNLSYDIDDAMLKAEFDSYGTVVSARVIKNKYNNRSRGYGFVEMSNEKEANKAVKATHGKEVLGRKLVVNIARSSSRD